MGVQQVIENKLTKAFDPEYLRVVNESNRHNVPANSETHFKVTIAAGAFENQRLVTRHQAIYRVLADELQSGVHALALHTFTIDEWQDREVTADSPPCLGGSK